MKTGSFFYKPELINQIRSNISKYAWAQRIKDGIEAELKPFLKYSEDELWESIFGNTIKRSWMVWSAGYCPSCGKGVPMYNWIPRVHEAPWKMSCPHCNEAFPKNDFAGYYSSGLDAKGVFDPNLADSALLYNEEHPDPSDPLYKFGVDDGDGYVDEKGNRWRFIGAYLIYGQWKKLIIRGIVKFAEAYIVTGKKDYARKAAIMLDRLSDLFSTFDYYTQGVMYDVLNESIGWISYWCDSCLEVRELALAYDQIFDTIKEDTGLVEFLSGKAYHYEGISPKNSFSDIQSNIEQGFLGEVLAHPEKIHCNYPQTDITVAYIKSILSCSIEGKDVQNMIKRILTNTTWIDGTTGEKGLAGYTSFALASGLAPFIMQYSYADCDFLKKALVQYPELRKTYKFHINTWCLQKYYPQVGDTGNFAQPMAHYAGVNFAPGLDAAQSSSLEPSMATFMWKLYEATEDVSYLQVLKREYAEDASIPWDLTMKDAESCIEEYRNIIEKAGKDLTLGSINLEQYHLAVLRSGKDENARALWISYDSGGMHGHFNGMNIGLFGKGLDLLPDFGYPPVQFGGGWGSAKANWYRSEYAHNQVVVDELFQQKVWSAKTSMWGEAEGFKAIAVTNSNVITHKQLQRTIALIDISDKDFYVLDVYRVAGGKEHIKLTHSYLGEMKVAGLNLKPAEDLGRNTLFRNTSSDLSAKEGWSADISINDFRGLLPEDSDIHVRITDLTPQMEASVCETWIAHSTTDTRTYWIPQLICARRSEKGQLASTFIAVIDPYDKIPAVKSIRRIPLHYKNGGAALETDAAIEVLLADGRKDIIITTDTEDPMYRKVATDRGAEVCIRDLRIDFSGELCRIRFSAGGTLESVTAFNSEYINISGINAVHKGGSGTIEYRLVEGKPEIYSDMVELMINE